MPIAQFKLSGRNIRFGFRPDQLSFLQMGIYCIENNTVACFLSSSFHNRLPVWSASTYLCRSYGAIACKESKVLWSSFNALSVFVTWLRGAVTVLVSTDRLRENRLWPVFRTLLQLGFCDWQKIWKYLRMIRSPRGTSSASVCKLGALSPFQHLRSSIVVISHMNVNVS